MGNGTEKKNILRAGKPVMMPNGMRKTDLTTGSSHLQAAVPQLHVQVHMCARCYLSPEKVGAFLV